MDGGAKSPSSATEGAKGQFGYFDGFNRDMRGGNKGKLTKSKEELSASFLLGSMDMHDSWLINLQRSHRRGKLRRMRRVVKAMQIKP